MTDLIAFSMGVAAGALAIYVPWIAGPFRRYVAFRSCPRPSQCPHHRAEWQRAINDANERTRNGPTRPNIR